MYTCTRRTRAPQTAPYASITRGLAHERKYVNCALMGRLSDSADYSTLCLAPQRIRFKMRAA